MMPFLTATTKPFRLTFVTDGDEFADGVGSTADDNEQSEAPGGIVGFALTYTQHECV
jgi:hypothetical protein